MVRFEDGVSEHAVPLEKDFIVDGKVDMIEVSKYADVLPDGTKEAKVISAQLDKKSLLHTPVGTVKIDAKNSFNHLSKNTHGQNRFVFSGGFLPTLKDLLFVVKDTYKGKETAVFYKPFKDESDNVVHLAGYAIDKDGKLVNTTFFDINTKKLKKYMEVENDKLLFYKYLKDDTKSLSSHSKRVDTSSTNDESIAQNVENVKKDTK